MNAYVGGDVTLRIVGTTGNGWSSDIAVDDLSVSAGGATDTQAPTAPTGLAASNVAETTLTLNWNASSDNVGVTGYDVYQGSANLGEVTTTSASITGLTASTSYTFTVRAKDAAGNISAASNAVNVTTLNGGGITCGSTASLPYSEGFESNDGWTQVTGDDGNWVRNSGATPSNGTGPGAASEGSFYMFLEASTNNSPGQIGSDATAILESDCFDLAGASAASFGFQYHMNGTNIGSLTAQASSDGSTWTNIWTISGSQGNSWQSADVDLAAYLGGDLKLRIVGTTGGGWSSDIAIDDLNVTSGGTSGTTSATLSITFDNYPEDISWEVRSGSTVLASGGNYGSEPDGSTKVETFDLSDGCYDFVITDSYGDGLCCTYGNGSYTLTASGTTLVSGATFGASETTNFCVGGATSSYAISTTSVGRPVSFEIYPNPVVGNELNIATERTEVAYNITNLSGQTIAAGELINNQVDVSRLNEGIYMIELSSGGRSVLRKFIKD
ncbi:MAG: T9SS type A sorting domain-containing protein [Bacteroidota bacterium]